MIIWLNKYLNFKYKILSFIPFRIILSLLTSFIIILCIGPYFIKYLKISKKYQIIRKNGPKRHSLKKNTPTMGGILILIAILFSTFMYCNLSNIYIWYVISILVGYGIIGLIDDFIKIKYNNTKGLKISSKFFLLSVVGTIIILAIFYHEHYFISIKLIIPFFTTISLKYNYLYIILSYFVVVGTSNAVNLTDGLDGLAIMPIIFLSCALGVISFLSSNIYFSDFTHVIFSKKANELIILCSTIIGSGLGFLWFNTYPSKIFMGDIGSLSLGGALGVISILLHQELLLLILGGIFLIEAISVILQIIYFKYTHKRIFKMAPIHHHYEIKGLLEPLIIVRFWIVSLLLTFIGIISLKVYY